MEFLQGDGGDFCSAGVWPALVRRVTLQKTAGGTPALRKNGATVFQSPRLETFSLDRLEFLRFLVY
jgi:hypothetical protein